VDVLRGLVEYVSPALDEAGDLIAVRELLAALLARGTGAQRQRDVLRQTGNLAAVVRDATRA
jgi:glutamate---cysteine ligase / carboxylate-amine ligase